LDRWRRKIPSTALRRTDRPEQAQYAKYAHDDGVERDHDDDHHNHYYDDNHDEDNNNNPDERVNFDVWHERNVWDERDVRDERDERNERNERNNFDDGELDDRVADVRERCRQKRPAGWRCR
jgi:hypothetical protein